MQDWWGGVGWGGVGTYAGMTLRQCKWNCNGTVLALAGSQLTKLSSGDQREVSLVQFYNPFGQHLRTLKVPGSGIQELSWEGGGLRIAVRLLPSLHNANCVAAELRCNTLSLPCFSHTPLALVCMCFCIAHSSWCVRFCFCSWLWARTCTLPTFARTTSGRALATPWCMHSTSASAWSSASFSGTPTRTTATQST